MMVAHRMTETRAAVQLAKDRGRMVTYWLMRYGSRTRWNKELRKAEPTTDADRQDALRQAVLWAHSFERCAVSARMMVEAWAEERGYGGEE